jgi:hypothetical protein
MNNRMKIDEQLKAVENLSPAPVKPFFYGRLMSRMEKEKEVFASFPLKPKWIIAALVTLLFVNGFVLTRQEHRLNYNSEQSLQSFATNYNFPISTYK